MLLLAIPFVSYSQDSTQNPDNVPAVYKKGEAAMYQTLANSIDYPISSRRDNRAGLVHVSFTVDEKGKISDVVAEKKEGFLLSEVVVVGYTLTEGKEQGVDSALKSAAITAVKRLGKFKPAQKDGIEVSSILVIPIKFLLRPSP